MKKVDFAKKFYCIFTYISLSFEPFTWMEVNATRNIATIIENGAIWHGKNFWNSRLIFHFIQMHIFQSFSFPYSNIVYAVNNAEVFSKKDFKDFPCIDLCTINQQKNLLFPS